MTTSTRCKICDEDGCEAVVPAADVRIVAAGLKDQYGRSLRWALRDLASQLVHEVSDAGRLGAGPLYGDHWQPSEGDAHDLGGPLANYQGEMRLWRAEEIGFYGLLALGRAGRFLDQEATPSARDTP